LEKFLIKKGLYPILIERHILKIIFWRYPFWVMFQKRIPPYSKLRHIYQHA
jgi:hypothetical protein